MNQKILSICAVLTALLMLNGIGAADNTQPMTLEERVTALEKGGGGKSAVNVSWDNGLKLKSADGGKTLNMNIGGRVQWDSVFVSQNDKLKTSLGGAAAATNTDQSGLRRARFEMAGTVQDRFLFKLEVDFAGGVVQLREAFTGIRFNDKKDTIAGSIRFGSVKEPGQLDQQTSDLHLSFIERPMLIVFHADYSIGILASGTINVDGVERMTWGIGGFRDVGGSGADTGAGKNGKYNWTARVTGLPIFDDGKESGKRILFHIGGHVSLRNPNTFTGGGQSVAYSARPGTSFGPTLVATGNVLAEKVMTYGGELGFVFNQIWFAAEYASATTSKPEGSAVKDATFNGFYAALGFFLTGESRSYKNSSGAWDRIKPKTNFLADDGNGGTGIGAIEIAARYDFLDLEDTNAGVFGGKLTTVGLAVNWYWNPNFRFMLDYLHAELDQKLAAPPKNEGAEDLLTTRFQCDF